MISLTETTITISALIFIVILIILAKISHQLDSIFNLLKQVRRKETEQEETSKWSSDSIKSRLDKIEKKLQNKTGGNNLDIPWKG